MAIKIDAEYHRKWREANAEKARAACKKWYDKNSDWYRTYRAERRDHVNKVGREWRKRNPDKAAEADRIKRARLKESGEGARRSRAHRERYPEKQLLRAAKQRASRDGRDFNIDVSDVVIPETCPILGIPIALQTQRMHPNSPSLDRIDPRQGYTKGNVWVISWQANRMKHNATPEELLTFAKGVLRIFKRRELGE